jgi:hypothetical protein
VVTTQNIVPQASPYYPVDGDVDFDQKPIDAVHALQRVVHVSGAPGSFSTWTTSMFTFPGILSYLSFALVSLAAANRKEPQWTAGIRASFSAPTIVRNYTEYFTYQIGPNTPYTWAQTDIVFKGLSYSVNLQNVLTDAWSNIGVTYASDTYYGNTVDRFSISATSPSATSYVSLIGGEQCISSVVDRYKMYWIRKSSYVVLR